MHGTPETVFKNIFFLIFSKDMNAISANLEKLIEKRDQMKNITFTLVRKNRSLN